MGIRLLVSTAQVLGRERAVLAIFGAPALVRQVFEVVSLDRILPVCSTEAEAVAAVTASAS
jgi:anti-anti-sigma regulatory factor